MTSHLPVSWVAEYIQGASWHGNHPGCVAAEQAQDRFVGGDHCPHRCGSIIRHRAGMPPEEAVKRHAQDPWACRKHPGHRKARRGRTPRTSAQVSQAALADRGRRTRVRLA